MGYSGKQRSYYDKSYHLHEKIEKTALGSDQNLKITMLDETSDLFTFAKKQKLQIIAIEQDPKSTPINKWQPQSNSIIVLGHERQGVSDEIMTQATEIVEIPRKGIHHSLNVSTTAGIVLFYLSFFNN